MKRKMKIIIISIINTIVVSAFGQSIDFEELRYGALKGKPKKVSTHIMHLVNGEISTHPRCEICPEYQVYNLQGEITAEQQYVITEPVDALSQGYCFTVKNQYSADGNVDSKAKRSKYHGIDRKYQDTAIAPAIIRRISGDTIYERINSGLRNWIKDFVYVNDLMISSRTPQNETFYEYDDIGREIDRIQVSQDYDFNDTIYTSIKYSNAGLKLEETDRTVSYLEGELFFSRKNKKSYSYYASGNLKSYTKYISDYMDLSKNPKVKIYFEKFYTKLGNDSLEIQHSGNTTQTIRTEYTYQKNGKIFSDESFNNDILRFKSSYDKKGRMLERKFYKKEGEFTSKHIITYKGKKKIKEEIPSPNLYYDKALVDFDKKGNWVRINLYEKNKLVSITTRKIEYF